MQYRALGNTDIQVSLLTLGTMTYGEQNTQAEAFEQMDYAVAQGINTIDVAEMYPVPPKASTYGESEAIVGRWLVDRGMRDKIVLATKVTGNGVHNPGFEYIRGGPRPSGLQIKQAIDSSLQRLQTDYVDLYQIHWPERLTNTFGVRDYKHDPDDSWKDNFNEVLHALEEMIKAGKIRHIGMSNEKAWGAMRYMEESRTHDLPRMCTIQNAYSLINRVFEGDMAEVSLRENMGLLAYSPMAFGVLSGKYIKGIAGDNSRLKLFPRFSRYSGEQCTEAAKKYLKIAEDNDYKASLINSVEEVNNVQKLVIAKKMCYIDEIRALESENEIDINILGCYDFNRKTVMGMSFNQYGSPPKNESPPPKAPSP